MHSLRTVKRIQNQPVTQRTPRAFDRISEVACELFNEASTLEFERLCRLPEPGKWNLIKWKLKETVVLWKLKQPPTVKRNLPKRYR